MRSMSFGFRSAMRLTPLSCVCNALVPALPAFACVTELMPFWITVFDTGTPSTT